MSLALCVAISPVVTIIDLCIIKKVKGKIPIFIITSATLTTLQYIHTNAFKYNDTVPEWIIVTTGISYAFLLSSIFKYFLNMN